ncbi:hypothetical protein MHY30_05720 [Microbacterium sp. ACRRU]|jgi:hypothetical protein|uniref:hypothetical protein n=1 Tax=Microbacterium sp. ACRRU TaxID=2918204 RepID=UPI001EF5544D|nr:hypothetical protein [Microbacterium sp. ACRRU]MCG7417004.1 hypothetical protein [Microbacterium sp. ACRRU]
MSAPQTIDATFLPEFPVPVREPRRLHLVDAPARRRVPRRAFGVIAVLGAVTIALVQMGLSILTTQSSFEIAELTQQQRDLTYQKQILYDEVAGLNSPQYLAANAAALGMVIDETPTYLRLSDGAVIGAGKPSEGASSVDAIGRGSVRNALISGVPLVTDPRAAVDAAPGTDAAAASDGPADAPVSSTGSATPPPISDGLPTPATR